MCAIIFYYTHTPVFKGGFRKHKLYEKNQKVSAGDILPILKQKCVGLSLFKLIEMLDSYVLHHERLLDQNAEMAYMDIPVAIYAATWVASSAYLYRQPVINMEIELEQRWLAT